MVLAVGNEQVIPVTMDSLVLTSPVAFAWVVPQGWLGTFDVGVLGFDASYALLADATGSITVVTEAIS